MDESRGRSIYPFLVWPLFVIGVSLSVVLLCSQLDIFDVSPFSDLSLFLHSHDAEQVLILLFLCGAGLFLLSSLIYWFGLDPFRADRPSGLVYLNAFPLSLFAGTVYIITNIGANKTPSLFVVILGVVASFLLPLIAIAAETALARTLSGLGRAFDERGWRALAFFCLKNSLRWRPSVHETSRRCGLLLVELGRYKLARQLLERIAPIATSEDFEVLHALETVYTAEGMSEEALGSIRRQRVLRPHARGIDQRYLKQCLALDRREEAIEILESGRIPMDLETLFILQDLYTKTGNIAQALARARQIADMESPPYPRSIALHHELLEKMPNNLELLIDLGMLLQKTGLLEQMQEGAGYLEQAVERDPRRLHLRRQLAKYYRETMQHHMAEGHFKHLIDEGDLDPETYLHFAEILKADRRMQEAREVYKRMQSACDTDWRGYVEEAEILLLFGDLEAADVSLGRGAKFVPEAEMSRFTHLRKRVQRRREEISLQEISNQLDRDGTDFQKRFDYIRQLMALDKGERAIAECDELLDDYPSLLAQVQRVLEEGLAKVNHGYRLRDYLADLYFRQERYDDMLRMFEEMSRLSMNPEKVMEEGCLKILHRAPDHLAARIQLIEVYRQMENWKGVLESAAPLMENLPEGYERTLRSRWVEANHSAGNFKEALQIGFKMLPEMKDDVQFLTLMIRVLEDNGEYSQAYELFKVAIELFPEDETLKQLEKTVADNKMRNRMEVLQSVEAKGQLTPQQHYEKADLHREYGQIQFAIVHYQRAADDATLHDVAMAKLAVCLCERRMFDLADETLDPINLTKEKIGEYRELKGLFYHVADVLEYEHYRDSALKYYKRLFRVDASFRDVVSRLERLGEK